MNFSKLAVRTRLYFGFGLMLVILVAVTIISISQVVAINGALRANSDQLPRFCARSLDRHS